MKAHGLVLMLAMVLQAPAQPRERAIVFTIDDLPTVSVLGDDLARARRTTEALLAAVRRQEIPAIGFVNEGKLVRDGRVDPAREALLQAWIDSGLDLGNHTYSHTDLHRVDLKVFEADVARGEAVTRRLLEKAGKRLTYFRHPFLHTGHSAQVRREVDAFLHDRGYVIAPVTIDNYDYIFAAAYDRTVAAGKEAEAERIAGVYLDYLESVVSYYEQQAQVIVGRAIPHTLLLHAHALNGATVERLAERLRARGYRFITLAEALSDPAYRSPDEYYGPAGISWLHRWALTAGKRGVFAGEPAVPEWIQRAADGK